MLYAYVSNKKFKKISTLKEIVILLYYKKNEKNFDT